MRKITLGCLAFLLVTTLGFAETEDWWIETIHWKDGSKTNYVLSGSYQTLEALVWEEYGMRINIGQTEDWTEVGDDLDAKILNLLKSEASRQSHKTIFALAIFTTGRGSELEEIVCFWAYQLEGRYYYKACLWDFE